MDAVSGSDRKPFAIIAKNGNERAYAVVGNASNTIKIVVRTKPTWVSKSIVSRIEYR